MVKNINNSSSTSSPSRRLSARNKKPPKKYGFTVNYETSSIVSVSPIKITSRSSSRLTLKNADSPQSSKISRKSIKSNKNQSSSQEELVSSEDSDESENNSDEKSDELENNSDEKCDELELKTRKLNKSSNKDETIKNDTNLIKRRTKSTVVRNIDFATEKKNLVKASPTPKNKESRIRKSRLNKTLENESTEKSMSISEPDQDSIKKIPKNKLSKTVQSSTSNSNKKSLNSSSHEIDKNVKKSAKRYSLRENLKEIEERLEKSKLRSTIHDLRASPRKKKSMVEASLVNGTYKVTSSPMKKTSPLKKLKLKKVEMEKKVDISCSSSSSSENENIEEEEDEISPVADRIKNRKVMKVSKKKIEEIDVDFVISSEGSCPLPCREKQFQDVWSFVKNNLEGKSSGCLYVSGVPGTGKTAIVKTVLRSLCEELKNEDELRIKEIYINGLTLSAPNKIWKRFYLELNPELREKKSRISPNKALEKLQLHFEEKFHHPIILIVDELDQVLDKQQAILYRLLDWSSEPSNLFSLICIFNTMHLPESFLTMRNASRMGMNRCVFPPYTSEQLSIIVSKAIGKENAKKLGDALMILSRKVAAISGDARRALELGKRTLEIFDLKGSIDSVKAVSEAFEDLFSAPKITAIKNSTHLEKLILRTIMGEVMTSSNESTTIKTVLEGVSLASGFEGLTQCGDHVMRTLYKLAASKLIIIENPKSTFSIHHKVLLNLSVPDIKYGLEAADKLTQNLKN